MTKTSASTTSADRIKLYRGDCSLIDSFDYSRTESNCAAGRGFYLTASKKLASTYRVKGAGYDQKLHMLFEGVSSNMPEALEAAFQAYLKRYRSEVASIKNERLRLKAVAFERELFDRRVKSGEVATQISSSNNWVVIRLVKPEFPIGYLSIFSFDKREFETGILNLGGVTDPCIWEMVYDVYSKLPFYNSKYGPSREEYVRMNIGKDIGLNQRNDFYLQLQKALEPYGYRGFEYEGGFLVGGHGYHRAFCVWDADYINKHKIHVTAEGRQTKNF